MNCIDMLCDEELITLAYQLILKRKPDPLGFDHFFREIQIGRVSRNGIIDEMIMSRESAEKKRFLH